MFSYCTASFSWTTSIGNASRSSNPSTKSRIWILFSPLRAGTCLHNECLRSQIVAAEGRLPKLDQTLVIGSGGRVETRILIDTVVHRSKVEVGKRTPENWGGGH